MPKMLNLLAFGKHCHSCGKLMNRWALRKGGGIQVPCHRIILSAASEFLAGKLYSSEGKSTDADIILEGVDGNALSVLIEYFYTGKLDLEKESTGNLLGVAKLFNIKTVEDLCIQFLIENLCVSNCIFTEELAERLGYQELALASRNFFLKNFEAVAKENQFLTLSADNLIGKLSSDELVTINEEQVFLAVARWLDHDVANRAGDTVKVLSCVRIPLLSHSFIFDIVSARPDCMKFVLDGLRNKDLPEHSKTVVSRKCHKSPIFLFGVEPKNYTLGVHTYYPLLGKWKHSHCSVLYQNIGAGMTAIDWRVFIVSGTVNGSMTESVQCFDIRKKQSTDIAPMKVGRLLPGVAILDGFMYVLGGGLKSGDVTDSAERYCLKTKFWENVAPMISPRDAPGVVAMLGRIYVIGGANKKSLNLVEYYNPDSNTWIGCSPMPTKRQAVGIAAFGSHIYVVGGYDGLTAISVVERYDPTLDKWERMGPLHYPRYEMAVMQVEGRLFAIGGVDKNRDWSDYVEAYDPVTNNWEILEPMKEVVPESRKDFKPQIYRGVCCSTDGGHCGQEQKALKIDLKVSPFCRSIVAEDI